MQLKKISYNEMKNISGGWSFNASYLSSLIRGVNSFLDIGRSIGSAIRRISAGKYCPL